MIAEICNTLFLYGIVLSLCAETVPSKPQAQFPDRGEVITSSCEGTDLVENVADGQGGSKTKTTQKSSQCGYQEPLYLSEGTLIKSGCSKDYPGVEWFEYADGQGGSYVLKDTTSRNCGWHPPTMLLELEKPRGDRFKPVIVNVNYTNFLGESEPWGMVHASTTMGSMKRDGDNILIYGTGDTGTGILTLGRNEIQFEIVAEPRCGKESSGFTPDCMGYDYSGPTDGYIYYGEDDDQIVEWEVAYFLYDKQGKFNNEGRIENRVTELFEEGSEAWLKVQDRIDYINQAYERSGVHVKLVMRYGNIGKAYFTSNQSIQTIVNSQANADVGIGRGYTCPNTCGCARVWRNFPENSNFSPVALSACAGTTDTHELGHSVGLAHGPNNRAYPQDGYIWREFGHGWESLCGRNFPDIMSYDSGKIAHHNSRLTCGEMYGDLITGKPESWSWYYMPAGYRDYADAAYHLNRIRYDVSLINCEDKKCKDSPVMEITSDGQGDPDSLIEDWIFNIPQGYELLEMGRSQDKELMNSSIK